MYLKYSFIKTRAKMCKIVQIRAKTCKNVHLKYFGTQFKNVHLRGPCRLRPCISRPYCIWTRKPSVLLKKLNFLSLLINRIGYKNWFYAFAVLRYWAESWYLSMFGDFAFLQHLWLQQLTIFMLFCNLWLHTL